MPTSAQRSISSDPCIWTQGRAAEAEALFNRFIAIKGKGLGSDAIAVATGLEALGREHEARGPQAADELLFKRVLTIREQALAPTTPMSAQRCKTWPGFTSARVGMPRR
jgi:hypothetical protein